MTGGPRHDLARFGMEKTGSTPREADLMIVAGRVSQKMAPVLRQIYDQMPEPKWVISMGVCASSGGMFNNYAIVQGVDHIVPVDIYLPGCPPRPEMLIDAIFKLHDKILNMKLGPDRDQEITELEEARLNMLPLHVSAGINDLRERTVSEPLRRGAAPPTSRGDERACPRQARRGAASTAPVVRTGMFGVHGTRTRPATAAPGAPAAAARLRAAVRRLLRRGGRGARQRAAGRRERLRRRGRAGRRATTAS